MSIDEPNYADRVARRVRVMFIVSAVGLLTTSLAIGSSLLFFRPSWFEQAGLPPVLDVLLVWILTVLGGVLVMAGFGTAASWIHQTLWPEHPDEG